jgi:hypothetical protein
LKKLVFLPALLLVGVASASGVSAAETVTLPCAETAAESE